MDEVENASESISIEQMFKDIDHVAKVNFRPSPIVTDSWSVTPQVTFYECSYDPDVITSMDGFLRYIEDTLENSVKDFREPPKLVCHNDIIRTPKKGNLVLVVNNEAVNVEIG